MTSLSRATVSSRERFCWVRRIRPPQLQTPALRTSDRRQARADLVQDLRDVHADCLEHCDRDDRNQCQDQRVLDERLSFLTLEAIPHGRIPAVQLCLNPQHCIPSLHPSCRVYGPATEDRLVLILFRIVDTL